jgi:hypothetical protein
MTAATPGTLACFDINTQLFKDNPDLPRLTVVETSAATKAKDSFIGRIGNAYASAYTQYNGQTYMREDIEELAGEIYRDDTELNCIEEADERALKMTWHPCIVIPVSPKE